MKKKSSENRGGAREQTHRKVRLEFWDMFSKLVETNHILTKDNEYHKKYSTKVSMYNKELENEIKSLKAELGVRDN